jgi:hypothetical protein
MTKSMEQQLADYGEHLQYLVEEMEVPTGAEIGDRSIAPPARIRRRGWAVAVATFAVSLVIGGVTLLVLQFDEEPPPADEPPETTVVPMPAEGPWPPYVGSEEIPGPVAAYEGLAVDKLGLRVPLGPPEQTRADFLADLDARGWLRYTDPVVGWSVRYPASWTIGEGTDPGRRLFLETPSPGDGLVITLSLDASPDDASSYDYHVGYIERAVSAGELYPVLDAQTVDDYWTPIDVDFDGRFDRQDITGTDFYRAVDDQGNQLPNGHPLGNFWGFAYYDPAAEPPYAYRFEETLLRPEVGSTGPGGPVRENPMGRFGEDGKWPAIDWIVLSFEPPDGYP